MNNNNNIKIGDCVLITDGSYAVRVDKYEPSTFIGLNRNIFRVLRTNNLSILHSQLGVNVHDIFIQDTKTDYIYLHSAKFVRVVDLKCKFCGR